MSNADGKPWWILRRAIHTRICVLSHRIMETSLSKVLSSARAQVLHCACRRKVVAAER